MIAVGDDVKEDLVEKMVDSSAEVEVATAPVSGTYEKFS